VIITKWSYYICQFQNILNNYNHLFQCFINNAINLKDLQEEALFYKNILPNYETYAIEFKICLSNWTNVPKKYFLTSPASTTLSMSKGFYPNIHSLLIILTTLPNCQLPHLNDCFQLYEDSKHIYKTMWDKLDLLYKYNLITTEMMRYWH